MRITYRVEEQELGTAGAVKNCADFIGDEDVLVISGDAACDLDLTELMASLMPAMVDAIMAETASQAGLEGLDLSALGFKVETGRVFASGELYDFNAVGTIEIPAEALDAQELEAA